MTARGRSEEHTSELQSRGHLVCRLLLDYVKAALDTCKGKLKTFAELPAYAGFYFTDDIAYEPEAAALDFTAENRPRLERLREAFAAVPVFTAVHLEACLKNLAGELCLKPAALVHPTRLACTGRTIGPSLYHLLEVIGKEKVLTRLERALETMKR